MPKKSKNAPNIFDVRFPPINPVRKKPATAPKFPQKTVFDNFWDECFQGEKPSSNNILYLNDKVYITPEMPDVKNCGIVRSGVFAGEIKGKRFEPSHSLFAAFGRNAKNIIDLSLSDNRVIKFLKGEEIECDNIKGYAAVLVEGIPLSFGKASSGRLKNHYPKGLRLIK